MTPVEARLAMRDKNRNRAFSTFVFALVLSLIAIPTAASAQETQDTTKLAAPLRTARAELTAAYVGLNPQAAARFFSDSAVVDFQGQVITGKPGVTEWLVGSLQGLSSLRFGSASFTVSETQVVERASYTVTTTDGTEQAGSSEATWRKQADGSWKVVRLVVG
jgi:ketosteroid isomerase-like protein